jgi:hypothetical protein
MFVLDISFVPVIVTFVLIITFITVLTKPFPRTVVSIPGGAALHQPPTSWPVSTLMMPMMLAPPPLA